MQKYTTKQLLIAALAFFIGNSVVVAAAHAIFPTQVVLGTHRLSLWLALAISMAVLTAIDIVIIPVTQAITAKRQPLTNMQWMLLYFVVNIGSLWLITRYPEMFGLGVASWLFVVGLGVVVNFLQGMLIGMVVQKMK